MLLRRRHLTPCTVEKCERERVVFPMLQLVSCKTKIKQHNHFAHKIKTITSKAKTKTELAKSNQLKPTKTQR